MSSSLIPIADDSIYWSSLLFDLTQPVLLTEQQYDAYWPLISTVYTKIGGLLLQKNGTIEVQNYECRLRKSKKPGQVPPKDGVKKRYGSTVRQSGLCKVRIKTTRTVNQPIVITIERLGNDEHLHSLDRSREVAPSALSIQQSYVSLFEECGWEVYETMGWVHLEREETGQVDSVRTQCS